MTELTQDLDQKLEVIDVDELCPYENNPKQHPDEQVEKIAESIREYGYTVPIVVDKENQIIAGHGRHLAITEHLDVDRVACIRRDDMTEAQVQAFRLADNRIAESTWDIEKLGIEIEMLGEDDYDLDLTGFDDDELDFFDADVGEDANDAYEEWEEAEMPEYENEDETSDYSLKVHFDTREDLDEFSELVDQPLTEDTQSIWYPEQDEPGMVDSEYVSQETTSDDD